MKTIGFLPLRAGSKSIPNKNRREFLSVPLYEYQLSAMLAAKSIAEVFVYTDDKVIQNELEFRRGITTVDREPSDAQDGSSSEAALLNFIRKMKFSNNTVIVFGQATNPFVTGADYEKSLELIYQGEANSVVSVSDTGRFYWSNNLPVNYSPISRPRRQDFDNEHTYRPMYVENGAFYISKVKDILCVRNRIIVDEVKMYVMPSWTSVELDEELDWKIAELIYKEKMNDESNSIW